LDPLLVERDNDQVKMFSKTRKTLDVRSRDEWRKWLAEHHDLESDIYIAWIDSAKQQETKMRRLREAIGLLAAGKMLGVK
jgi:uncharacterized protein YdeI (YjbR/CyaY-like superfamily)